MARIIAVIVVYLTTPLAFSQERRFEDRLERQLDLAIASYYLNESNIGDYAVQFAGNMREITEAGDFLTAFSGITAVRQGKLRVETFTKGLNYRCITTRRGMLKTGDKVTVVDGVDKEVEPRELSEEEKESTKIEFGVNPFKLMHMAPNGIKAGDASVLKKSTDRFVRKQLLDVFNHGDDQIGGIWLISDKYKIVQIVQFGGSEIGMMPTRVEYAKLKKLSDLDDLKREDVDVWSSVSLRWKEPKPGIYLLVFADYVFATKNNSDEHYMQLRLDWDLDPRDSLFTTDDLLNLHRSEGFGYIEELAFEPLDIELDESR